jgi:enoyl-CoA hydratase/carnithine racemase
LGGAVLLERRDNIGRITMNRPQAANAINREMARGLREAFLSLDSDKETWVIVLVGAGERVFCSGLDLRERRNMSEEEITYSRRVEIFPLYMELENIETPIIAAINGAAVGGGAELAMACDIRVASENASFGLPEVKWGIIPAAGAIQHLPAIVGMGVARELILTGRIIDARRAEALGIFNQVVPAHQLIEKALSIAEELKENSPVALRQAKKALNFREAAYYGMGYDREASEVCYRSEDRKEGVLAFSEKRKPKWKNE